MPTRLQRTEEGFTVIELLITLVVLSLGLLALAGLQVSAIKTNAVSKRMTVATAVADAKIEQLKDTAYATVVSEAATSVTAGAMTFTRQVTVTANSPVANTKTIEVAVRWTQGTKTYTVPMTTIMSQR